MTRRELLGGIAKGSVIAMLADAKHKKKRAAKVGDARVSVNDHPNRHDRAHTIDLLFVR